jgi:hypothetical protein
MLANSPEPPIGADERKRDLALATAGKAPGAGDRLPRCLGYRRGVSGSASRQVQAGRLGRDSREPQRAGVFGAQLGSPDLPGVDADAENSSGREAGHQPDCPIPADPDRVPLMGGPAGVPAA